MPFDPERDPGRTYETYPKRADAKRLDPLILRELGGRALLASRSDPDDGRSPADPRLVEAIGSRAVAAASEPPAPAPPVSKGSGMSLRETMAEIATLQRAVSDQRRVINEFLRTNHETMALVRNELAGSAKGYDQQMLSELAQTEASLKASLANLERASTALDRVRAI